MLSLSPLYRCFKHYFQNLKKKKSKLNKSFGQTENEKITIT